MEMIMFDIVDEKLTVLKRVDNIKGLSINYFDWPDTAFYLLYDENEEGYGRISINFLTNGGEDIGFSCGDYYYSTEIKGRVYYIKFHAGIVSLVDIDEDTKRITKMKHKNIFEDLSLEKTKNIIANDGAR